MLNNKRSPFFLFVTYACGKICVNFAQIFDFRLYAKLYSTLTQNRVVKHGNLRHFTQLWLVFMLPNKSLIFLVFTRFFALLKVKVAEEVITSSALQLLVTNAVTTRTLSICTQLRVGSIFTIATGLIRINTLYAFCTQLFNSEDLLPLRLPPLLFHREYACKK